MGVGLIADWLVKTKGMQRRKERIKKTSRAKAEHNDSGTKREP